MFSPEILSTVKEIKVVRLGGHRYDRLDDFSKVMDVDYQNRDLLVLAESFPTDPTNSKHTLLLKQIDDDACNINMDVNNFFYYGGWQEGVKNYTKYNQLWNFHSLNKLKEMYPSGGIELTSFHSCFLVPVHTSNKTNKNLLEGLW